MICVVRGAGDIASGIAFRLWQIGHRVVMTELAKPTAIRRTVCFSEALTQGSCTVEGVEAVQAQTLQEIERAWQRRQIAVCVDPGLAWVRDIHPDAVIDAMLAKRNLGTTSDMAPHVIGVGPGFTAGEDVHAVVETMRGHTLGRVFYEGSALPNTAVPGLIGGFAGERVLRAPAAGIFEPCTEIGDHVTVGQTIAVVDGTPMISTLTGVLRGLLPAGITVQKGMKAGDVDPRDCSAYIHQISDKALAVAGGVLEALGHLEHTRQSL